jgi:hypothetical protein
LPKSKEKKNKKETKINLDWEELATFSIHQWDTICLTYITEYGCSWSEMVCGKFWLFSDHTRQVNTIEPAWQSMTKNFTM